MTQFRHVKPSSWKMIFSSAAKSSPIASQNDPVGFNARTNSFPQARVQFKYSLAARLSSYVSYSYPMLNGGSANAISIDPGSNEAIPLMQSELITRSNS